MPTRRINTTAFLLWTEIITKGSKRSVPHLHFPLVVIRPLGLRPRFQFWCMTAILQQRFLHKPGNIWRQYINAEDVDLFAHWKIYVNWPTDITKRWQKRVEPVASNTSSQVNQKEAGAARINKEALCEAASAACCRGINLGEMTWPLCSLGPERSARHQQRSVLRSFKDQLKQRERQQSSKRVI